MRMRSQRRLVAVLLAATACVGSSQVGTEGDGGEVDMGLSDHPLSSSSDPALSPPECARACASSCGKDEACVWTEGNQARCLKRCRTTDDCPAGEACAVLEVHSLTLRPPRPYTERTCISR